MMIGHRPEIVTNSAPTTIGVTARHVALDDLPTRQVVGMDGPHPPAELATIADRLRATSSSPAVPSTCPKHRSPAIIHGQPRSVPIPAEL
jgi:hypothetical protein